MGSCRLFLMKGMALAGILALSARSAPGAAATLPGDVTPGVAEVISELSSAEYAVREKGSRDLAMLPAEAYAPVKRAVDDPATDSEVRVRLEAALPGLERKFVYGAAVRRAEAERAWELAVTLEAYERVGKKNARWDGHVRAGMRLFLGEVRPDVAGAAAEFQKALAAGCQDPLALSLAAAASWTLPGADLKEARETAETAASRFGTSAGKAGAYPAFVRMNGMLLAVRLIRLAPGDRDADYLSDAQWFGGAVAQWPEVVAMPGISPARLEWMAMTVIDRAPSRMRNDAYKGLIKPLESSAGGKALLHTLLGKQCLAKAWEFRGGDIAARVGADNLELMNTQLTEARREFEAGYALAPENAWAATAMIEVELLQPRGRDEMEKWFRRAMAANPNNMEACNLKLTYLLPRWYGSHEIMIAFGKECAAEGNYQTRVPLMVLGVHAQLAQETGKGDDYYASPGVWEEIERVYSQFLTANPESAFDHSNYLRLAILAKQWTIARQQQQWIGDRPDLAIFKTRENYQNQCEIIASQGGGVK